jgi:hypothetical protein
VRREGAMGDYDFDRPEVRARVIAYREGMQRRKMTTANRLVAKRVCALCNRTVPERGGKHAGLHARLGTTDLEYEIAVLLSVPGRGDLAILCGLCDIPDDDGRYTMELDMVGYYRDRQARNEYGFAPDQEFTIQYSDEARRRRDGQELLAEPLLGSGTAAGVPTVSG